MKLLPVLLLVAAPVAAQAQFRFTTNNNTITITAYTGLNGMAVIPGTTNGYAVTTIGESAFFDNFTLTHVSIPNSVTNIGTLAFFYCPSLTNISVAADNPAFSGLNGVLFDKAGVTLLQYPIGLANSTYKIPDTVTDIGTQAFSDCLVLTGITIPGGVTNIEARAFSDCMGLQSVTIPVGVINIGEVAFWNCRSLTNIFVDAANPAFSSIQGVLFDKAGETLIQYPIYQTNSTYTLSAGATSIGKGAFYGCIWLNGVRIPNGVGNIGPEAFESCSYITNVSIPATVTNIGDGAFGGCTSLASAIIPPGVTSIGQGVFGACSHLTSVSIPNGVTSIAYAAFESCSSLTNLIIPATVTNIGTYALAYCTSLTSVYFLGDAPPDNGTVFWGDPHVTVYYLPGTTGWGATFGGAPVVLWNPQVTTFVADGNQFGFNITGPTNVTIVVEACSDLANPVWVPVSTNTLSSGGTSFFSDPQWTNYSARYYRFRSP